MKWNKQLVGRNNASLNVDMNTDSQGTNYEYCIGLVGGLAKKAQLAGHREVTSFIKDNMLALIKLLSTLYSFKKC